MIDRDQMCLIMEDDVLFAVDSWRRVEEAVAELTRLDPEWQMLYLGINADPDELKRSGPPQRLSSGLYRVFSGFATHAYIVRSSAYREVIDVWSAHSHLELPHDVIYSRVLLPRIRAYCVNPLMALQRPSFSQHLNRFSDYEYLELRWEQAISMDDDPASNPIQIAAPGSSSGNAPSICFVGTCYGAFLTHHYQAHPDLLQADYQTQLQALLQSGFGDADFYSRGMAAAGWRAWDLVANCYPIQNAWAREHGISADPAQILLQQIKHLQPDVVYIQDLSLATAEFLRQLRPLTRLVAGQIASPLPLAADLSGIDVMVSSFPHFVERFRAAGRCAYYQPLAFDPRMLERLGPRNPSIPFSFVGGISLHHARGTQLIADIAARTDLQVWGYGAEHLPADSLLRQRHRGEAWGAEMFRLLRSSQLTLNRHIDTAERFANNMRLFEATGTGALLVTDYKDNLADLFNIGEEVIAYRSAEECAELVGYFLAHRDEAEEIALAGQRRTLKDHSYERRMAQTAEYLEHHLRRPQARSRFGEPALGGISSGHQPIAVEDLHSGLTDAWKNKAIPARQRALVERQLDELYRGELNPPFRVLADLLDAVVPPAGGVLEIGCSSGYYYEILEYLLNRRLDYAGVDYSESFIAMARSFYPKARFEVADGSRLPFADRAFPTVISSCILLHTPNFRDHIRESVRVAGSFVIAHRTPVCRHKPTQLLKKLAYEVETVELRFNESEFLQAFLDEGMILDRAIEFESHREVDEYSLSYRFRFEEVPPPELL